MPCVVLLSGLRTILFPGHANKPKCRQEESKKEEAEERK
jgi:hypothetical protein